MDWSAAAQIFLTTALVLVTAWYARANWRMVGEMQKAAVDNEKIITEMNEARIQQLRPIVLFQSRVEGSHLYLVVRNMGQGPAKNVRFNFQKPLVTKDGVQITAYEPFSQKGGIAFIAPQQEFTHWYGVTKDLSKRQEEGEILACSGQVEYDAVYFERHYSEPFKLDLSIYKQLHDNPLANMGPSPPPTKWE